MFSTACRSGHVAFLPIIVYFLGYYNCMSYFCFMKAKVFFLLTTTLLLTCQSLTAQEKWSLLKCVQYARDNNINVKIAAIPVQSAELQVKQDKMARYPAANLSNNYGMSFGRRENPTTGVFEDQKFFNIGVGLQTSVAIFNWYSQKNTLAADVLELQASRITVERLKNDISLTVANQYLAILLSHEQEKIANVQLQQSKSQLDITRKQVRAGALPELNAAEMENQVARDSASLITAKGNTAQSILTLKASLNIDAAQPFDIETPAVDKIPLDDIASLQPETVYNLAIKNQPLQQFNDVKQKAAEKMRKAAWAAMHPTISAFGGLNTNYIYFRTPLYERLPNGYSTTGLIVNNGGTQLDVLQPRFTTTDKVTGYFTPKSLFRQLSENFGQNIGINISVPIFNRGLLRTNFERSKLAVKNWDLVKEQDNQKLKQDIYQVYNSAIVAMEKFNASKKSVETAERSYSFAQKRYNIGMLSTLELITNQNNLFREKLQYVLNQFDYVFKMKVLEFYKGEGLKL
jgi:outer membrane protein